MNHLLSNENEEDVLEGLIVVGIIFFLSLYVLMSMNYPVTELICPL